MTPASTAPVALIYIRISQDREGAGLGNDRQLEDCLALTARLGAVVGRVYRDDDISAYSGKYRPEYETMLSDIAAGQGDMVVCWHTDRVYRRVKELLKYLDITNTRNMPTHGVTSGSLDLSTPEGRMMAIHFANVSEYESAHKAQRIKRKHVQSAQRGVWRGGSRPFGWGVAGEPGTDTNKINPAEAELIRRAYADVIAARSLGSIIKEWNAAGVLSTTRYRNKATGELAPGKPWNYSTLRQVLLRPRNYGASVYRDEVVGTGEWEPITDEATFRAVQAILRDPARRRSSNNVGKHLLAGIALCGVCADGTTMISGTANIRGTKVPIYRCRTGKHLARRADYSDRRVAEVVTGRVARKDAKDVLTAKRSPDRTDKSAKAVQLRAQLSDLKPLWRAGMLTRAEYISEGTEIKHALAALEAEMADPDRSRALRSLLDAVDGIEDQDKRAEAARAVWETLDWTQQRAAVEALMTVTIEPVPAGQRRRFDPAYVVIDWLV